MTLHALQGKTGSKSRRYHLVGVGGVGMSALAQLLLALGAGVSGSDRYYDQSRPQRLERSDCGQARDLIILKKLQALGVTLFAQDGGAVQNDLEAVVVSAAIEEDNPDLIAARAKEIKILRRAELLAALAKGKKIIAVTGTAGKTTVTGLIGFCLEQAGLDPTVVNGGAVLNWLDEKKPGNFRFGRSDVWVLELDESDRSLLYFAPDWAVITNISQDHFELDEVKALFAAFAKQVKNGIVGCDPLKNFEGVGRGVSAEPSYARTAHPEGSPYLSEAGKVVLQCEACSALNLFEVTERGISFQYRNYKFQLPLLGKHNIENALQCIMLCEKLGLDLNEISRAFEKFQGIERRLQVVGVSNHVTVIDDYAHNPAKIAAAWDAVRPFSKRIIAIWRPHGYGPLSLMYHDLRETFLKCARSGDKLVIMPVYFAGGTAQKQITARMFADDLKGSGLPVDYAGNYDVARAMLLKFVAPGDTVLVMGARDPDLPVFARNLVLELDHFFADRPAGARGIAEKDQAADQA